MPTYDYRCNACKHEFELFQSMKDRPQRKCPKCGKNMLEHLIGTGAAIVFKGSGFYQTDYRSDAYKKSAEADKKPADTKAEPKSDTKADSKPDTKSDAKTDTKSDPKSGDSKTEAKPATDPKPAKPEPDKKPSKSKKRELAMSPIAHGIDAVKIARIEASIAAHGEHFMERVFTARERAYSQPRKRAGEHFAARFAAKEAVFKALGTGWRGGISWTDVEVVLLPSGQPTVQLHGEAARIAATLNITGWLISLTHTDDLAIASVIATGP